METLIHSLIQSLVQANFAPERIIPSAPMARYTTFRAGGPADVMVNINAPAEIAVYEDALYAIQTAKDAGFYVVGVYDDSAVKNWLTIEKLADEIVLNWEEVI